MAVTRNQTPPFTEPPDLTPSGVKKKRTRFFEYSQTSSRSTRGAPKSAPRARSSKILGFKVKMKPLTQEKKLDFSGVLITFIGLLAFLALVSPAKSSFTGGLSEFFYQIAGIGAFLIPIAFFVVGMWVLFRSWERLPHFSAARLVGIGLLMLNVFTLIYFIAGAAFSGALGSHVRHGDHGWAGAAGCHRGVDRLAAGGAGAHPGSLPAGPDPRLWPRRGGFCGLVESPQRPALGPHAQLAAFARFQPPARRLALHRADRRFHAHLAHLSNPDRRARQGFRFARHEPKTLP